METEKSFSPIVGRVNSHFDLFAEDIKNRVVVDIQYERHEDHYDRFLHYHCVALLEQIASSKNYRPELKVFTIVVLTSGDKHKTDVATIDFDPKDLQGKALGEISHKVIYLCPKCMLMKIRLLPIRSGWRRLMILWIRRLMKVIIIMLLFSRFLTVLRKVVITADE